MLCDKIDSVNTFTRMFQAHEPHGDNSALNVYDLHHVFFYDVCCVYSSVS